ncbi:MAG TPA: o-succinylbenzoate synthase [Planctomycetes bacterium]|nr:o-succinylbenzoate synthase [Planctomycetota bacterium]
MHIDRVELFAYTLPLATPFRAKDRTHRERRGMLVRLIDAGGCEAYGEAAPFPGLRAEALQDAAAQLADVLPALRGRAIPADLPALAGGFDRWLGTELLPSVRFGIESAALGLIAASARKPLRAILAPDAPALVPINALFDGFEPDLPARAAALCASGYRAFKLKAGIRTAACDIAGATELRGALGSGPLIRIDAKCAWGLPEAVAIGRALAPLGIDYIEEPLADRRDLAAFHAATGIATALDENLAACLADGPVPPRGVRAFVIKPDIVGGLEAAAALCRRARACGAAPVISATFLSGVGLRVLAEFAAALAPPGVPMGLGTSAWLAEDLFAVPVVGGHIDLASLPPETRIEDASRLLRVEIRR